MMLVLYDIEKYKSAQIQTAVSNGNIRPGTPVSMNYAEHDAFSFTSKPK